MTINNEAIRTKIMAAIQMHHNSIIPDLIKEALEAGVSLDDPTLRGKNFLCEAVQRDNINAGKILLESGADINAKDRDERTPFFCACNYRIINAAKFLIDAGARWDIPDSSNMMPLDILEERYGYSERRELERYIQEHYSQARTVSVLEEPAYVQEL